jgi:hypothetical protein
MILFSRNIFFQEICYKKLNSFRECCKGTKGIGYFCFFLENISFKDLLQKVREGLDVFVFSKNIFQEICYKKLNSLRECPKGTKGIVYFVFLENISFKDLLQKV